MKEYREMRMIDVAEPDHVQISVEASEVWVNVDGICHFRAKRISEIQVEVQGKEVTVAELTDRDDVLATLHQEALDLFATNSGDILPTPQEVDNIREGISDILRRALDWRAPD